MTTTALKQKSAAQNGNGIGPLKDYAKHREALRQALPDGLILLSGGKEIPRNNDVHYVFRQKSNFLYLTGVPDPNYYLLLDPKRGRDILFIPRVDVDHRVWLGHVPGPVEARKTFGINDVRYNVDIPAALKSAKAGYRWCYADPEAWKHWGKSLGALANRLSALHEAFEILRAVKTPGEIELLRRANEISTEGHVAVMRTAEAGMREYEVQAEFERVCTMRGLRHQGYPSIVAAGKNGAVLHYTHNNDLLRTGELLLIDAGGECGGYSADITRTFPIGGRFSRRQRDIYSIVLDTQKECTRRALPGVLSGELHIHAMRMIAEGLRDLGFLRGSTDELVETGAVRAFFPHGLGHMLGLDVHDCLGGKARQVATPSHIRVRFNARLEPGFVITMEPGIYFIDALLQHPELRKKHRGRINFDKAVSFLDFGGVRIEDDVVIQPSGPPLNLTTAPKEIDDIESACR